MMRPTALMTRTASTILQPWAPTVPGTTRLPQARRVRVTTPPPKPLSETQAKRGGYRRIGEERGGHGGSRGLETHGRLTHLHADPLSQNGGHSFRPVSTCWREE